MWPADCEYVNFSDSTTDGYCRRVGGVEPMSTSDLQTVLACTQGTTSAGCNEASAIAFEAIGCVLRLTRD